MLRRLLLCLLLLGNFWILTNCVTTQIVYKDIPEDSILIKKQEWTDLKKELSKTLESCIRSKSELNECLEREKAKMN